MIVLTMATAAALLGDLCFVGASTFPNNLRQVYRRRTKNRWCRPAALCYSDGASKYYTAWWDRLEETSRSVGRLGQKETKDREVESKTKETKYFRQRRSSSKTPLWSYPFKHCRACKNGSTMYIIDNTSVKRPSPKNNIATSLQTKAQRL